MKPFKSGTVIAAWLLRLTLLWFVYQYYFKGFPGFDLKSFTFYIHATYIVFAVLLVVGGFLQKPGLTVVSGLVIFILPVVLLIHAFPKDIMPVVILFLLPVAIGFYFFTHGNGN
jgi:hypothetical protein